MLEQRFDVPDGVQALEALGIVTSGDYAEVFAPLVDRVRRAGQRLRLLYQFGPGFERLTAGALWADSKVGMSYLPLLDGCAVTSDINWIRQPARSIAAWTPCPMRVYGNAQRDAAATWLAALPVGQRPSNLRMARTYIGGTGGAIASIGRLALAGQLGAADKR